MRKIILVVIMSNISCLMTANYDSTLKELTDYINSLINGKYKGAVFIDTPRKIVSLYQVGVTPRDPVLLTLNDRTATELSKPRIIRPVYLINQPGFQNIKKDFLADVATFVREKLKPNNQVATYAMSYTQRNSKPESRVMARMQAIDSGDPIDVYYTVWQYGY